jgi:hypothetical protein
VGFLLVFPLRLLIVWLSQNQENKMAKTPSRNHTAALGNRPSTTNSSSNGINVAEHVRRIGAVRRTRRKWCRWLVLNPLD